MNYVVIRNEVNNTKIHHMQAYVEQVAKCHIEIKELGAKHHLCVRAKGLGAK